jgi:hypothetical protein
MREPQCNGFSNVQGEDLMHNMHELSRRALLGAAAAAATTLIASAPARAGSIPKTGVAYQDQPKDGHQCSGCKLFVAGASPDAPGTCKSVAGEINPKGWCKLFAAAA